MSDHSWLTDDEFTRFRALVAGESGIQLQDTRRSFVAGCLARRLTARGVVVDPAAVVEYRRWLEQGRDPDEMLVLLDSLTINETGFFRYTPQWNLFTSRVLPDLLAATHRAGRRRLRLWSAGCSIGAEPYTIAMVVAEGLAAAGADRASWDVRIRASDLSLTALAVAEAAVYRAERLRGVAPERLARHFARDGGGYRVRGELRRWVDVDFHNLLHPVRPAEGDLFDAIFCRNVLIYFNEADQVTVIRHLVDVLRPGGYLLLGHAETLLGVVQGFAFVHDAGGTAYRKEEA